MSVSSSERGAELPLCWPLFSAAALSDLEFWSVFKSWDPITIWPSPLWLLNDYGRGMFPILPAMFSGIIPRKTSRTTFLPAIGDWLRGSLALVEVPEPDPVPAGSLGLRLTLLSLPGLFSGPGVLSVGISIEIRPVPSNMSPKSFRKPPHPRRSIAWTLWSCSIRTSLAIRCVTVSSDPFERGDRGCWERDCGRFDTAIGKHVLSHILVENTRSCTVEPFCGRV